MVEQPSDGSPPAVWKETADLSDAALADLVRADKIDVLVDLAGHMGGHRLLAFARRPAPVQVTHFNYPDTTGMSAMTWRITDPIVEPVGGDDPPDRYSTERLYRLDHCAWCYHGGWDVPDVEPLPALKNGYVTFASLNKPLKQTPMVAAVWAKILKAVPNSRLLLLGADATGPNWFIREHYTHHGIAPDRVFFAPRMNRKAYLKAYGRADVALDPFPYNGGITSCDAMLMGVPLVALEGNTYHSRQGLMLLKNVGLDQLVARTEDDYVRIAVELVSDVRKLAELRTSLRDRLQGSPVMDGPAFARRLGNAYRAMWHDWCNPGAPAAERAVR